MTSPRSSQKEPKYGYLLMTLLYRTIKSPNDAKILQKELDTLQLWERTWKMEFHQAKGQLLKITNKLKPIKSNYTIHDNPLLESPSSKYLGVVIYSKLQWKEHYANITKSCNGKLAFLKRNLSKAS